MINPGRQSAAAALTARTSPAPPESHRQTGARHGRLAPSTDAQSEARAPEKKHIINFAMLKIIH